MDWAWTSGLLDGIVAHPGWATALVFLLALCEGLVVAGVVVPGATLLFIAGTLVGTGHLELWPTLFAAFLGALMGDLFSFWLGRHYGQRLRTYWPLSRYPFVLDKGDRFFTAHGGKSLLFGRFVGPVRGIIPAVAGMMGMAPRPFFWVTLFSALLWAPAYLLPGVVFGASLAVAGSVATRLVALLLLLFFAAASLWWIGRRVVVPRLRQAGTSLAWRARNWGRLHPLVANALTAPRYALRAFGYGAGWSWWVALAALVGLEARELSMGGPALVDEALLGLLAAETATTLRAFFVLPSLLLEPWVWGAAWVAGVVWVVLGGRWRVAAVIALIVPGAVVLAMALAVGGGSWSWDVLYRGAPSLSLPSPAVAGFTTLVLAAGVLATAAYGPLRRPVQVVGVAIPLLVAGSAVVVGRLWLTDALGGLLLGMVVAGLVVFARSGLQRRTPERSLPLVVATILVLALLVKAVAVLPEERSRFIAQADPPRMDASEWLNSAPDDALGRELRWLDGGQRAVDIQWLASYETVIERLDAAAWVEPDRRLYGALRWLQPEPEIERLLPLPRWYRGRLPAQIRVLPLGERERWVLRGWRAPVVIEDESASLWLIRLEHEWVRPGWPVTRVDIESISREARAKMVRDLLGDDDELAAIETGQLTRIFPRSVD